MSINETRNANGTLTLESEEDFARFMQELVDQFTGVSESEVERSIRLGVRAAILCLWQAGHLTPEALAYAGVLGQGDLDILLVPHLGIYRGKDERFTAEVEAAFEAHRAEVQRAVDDLNAAAADMDAKAEASDDGAGEASDATEE